MSGLAPIQSPQPEEAESIKGAVAAKTSAVDTDAGGGFLKSSPVVETDAAEDDDEASDEEGGGMDLEIALSPEALAALSIHLADKDAGASKNLVGTMEPPSENYGMSQFWWDDISSEVLGEEALKMSLPPSDDATGGSTSPSPPRIALLSAPSVWFALQRIKAKTSASSATMATAAAASEVQLLEFDQRFGEAAGSSFTYYDYTRPQDIPKELHHTFDYVFSGPPYVSEECIDQYLTAYDLLAKGPDTPRALVIGASLEDVLSARGFVMDDDLALGYRSKFCTPMRIYRKYAEGSREATKIGDK
jgi:hypothetical protein